MAADVENLEAECEDVVFELAAIRERYPAKYAKYLEKSTDLQIKMQTLSVQKPSLPKFELPEPTDEQKELLLRFRQMLGHKNTLRPKEQDSLKKVKELKSILQQIQKHAKLLKKDLPM